MSEEGARSGCAARLSRDAVRAMLLTGDRPMDVAGKRLSRWEDMSLCRCAIRVWRQESLSTQRLSKNLLAFVCLSRSQQLGVPGS